MRKSVAERSGSGLKYFESIKLRGWNEKMLSGLEKVVTDKTESAVCKVVQNIMENSHKEHHKKKYAQSEEKSLLSTTLTRKELDKVRLKPV